MVDELSGSGVDVGVFGMLKDRMESIKRFIHHNLSSFDRAFDFDLVL